jgi:hypothetical protein
MSWLYSQALVEEYLGANFSDGEQSVPLNGKPTQQAYCAPDKMTDFSRLSRFGMMFKPLTANLGEELLMSYLAGFHAKTSVQQEKAQELMEREVECGEKWHASFVKYDPDLSLWRTHQCSLLGDLEEFSETWPQWGLMRDGECWEQRMLEQTIRGTEFGLSEKFPTPQASDIKLKPTSASWKAKGGINYSLANPEIQAKWPTPRSCSAMAATITPESAWSEKRNPNLETIVGQRMFPTPCQRDYKGAVKTGKRVSKSGKIQNYGEQLPNAVGGQLNPPWVEWLMGWPLGWTDLKPLEMDKSHFVQQQHGESSQKDN